MNRQLRVIEGPDRGAVFTIGEQAIYTVGRGADCDFRIRDPHVSRTHFQIDCSGTILTLSNSSKNGTLVNGESVDHHELRFGDMIELGKSKVEYAATHDEVTELVYPRAELQSLEFEDAASRLSALVTLPELIIRSRTDEDLALRLADTLLSSIPHAGTVLVAAYPTSRVRARGGESSAGERVNEYGGLSIDIDAPHFSCARSRGKDAARPSQRLILRTLGHGESTLHVWSTHGQESVFTLVQGVDWAFCIPLPGKACRGWCFYVTGTGLNDSEQTVSPTLLGHLKFAETVAQFIGATRHVQYLEQQQAIMRPFFSPRVIKTLQTVPDEESLAPREAMVSVLSCDLRGFSRLVEDAEGRLNRIFEQVSSALGVMTEAVMNHDGVIADFQGDAILAFWGWPTPTAQGPRLSCLTALAIAARFAELAREASAPLQGFQVGIGITTGRAIAGKIGTRHQAKVGVFGAVVNQAARLEGMTKFLGGPILIDEATARVLEGVLADEEAVIEDLGRFQPAGMRNAIRVSRLVPREPAFVGQVESQVDPLRPAIQAFFAGDWSTALPQLAALANEPVAKTLTTFAQEHGDQPPPRWNGVVPLRNK